MNLFYLLFLFIIKLFVYLYSINQKHLKIIIMKTSIYLKNMSKFVKEFDKQNNEYNKKVKIIFLDKVKPSLNK